MMETDYRVSVAADGIDAIRPCGRCPARGCGVCSGVAGADLRRLATLASIVEIPRGQTFLHEDALAEHYCIPILGSAKLHKLLPDGRRQIIGFAYAGSFLGLTDNDRYAFSAEAIEPLRMCRMSRTRLQAALGDLRSMEQRLLEVAVNDLVRAQEQLLLLGRKTATERMASFLLLQTTRPQPRAVRRPRIYLPMSRNDIADYLGMTIETTSRSLAKLRKLDVIAVPNVHEIVILDIVGLERLSHGLLPLPPAEEVEFGQRGGQGQPAMANGLREAWGA